MRLTMKSVVRLHDALLWLLGADEFCIVAKYDYTKFGGIEYAAYLGVRRNGLDQILAYGNDHTSIELPQKYMDAIRKDLKFRFSVYDVADLLDVVPREVMYEIVKMILTKQKISVKVSSEETETFQIPNLDMLVVNYDLHGIK